MSTEFKSKIDALLKVAEHTLAPVLDNSLDQRDMHNSTRVCNYIDPRLKDRVINASSESSNYALKEEIRMLHDTLSNYNKEIRDLKAELLVEKQERSNMLAHVSKQMKEDIFIEMSMKFHQLQQSGNETNQSISQRLSTLEVMSQTNSKKVSELHRLCKSYDDKLYSISTQTKNECQLIQEKTGLFQSQLTETASDIMHRIKKNRDELEHQLQLEKHSTQRIITQLSERMEETNSKVSEQHHSLKLSLKCLVDEAWSENLAKFKSEIQGKLSAFATLQEEGIGKIQVLDQKIHSYIESSKTNAKLVLDAIQDKIISLESAVPVMKLKLSQLADKNDYLTDSYYAISASMQLMKQCTSEIEVKTTRAIELAHQTKDSITGIIQRLYLIESNTDNKSLNQTPISNIHHIAGNTCQNHTKQESTIGESKFIDIEKTLKQYEIAQVDLERKQSQLTSLVDTIQHTIESICPRIEILETKTSKFIFEDHFNKNNTIINDKLSLVNKNLDEFPNRFKKIESAIQSKNDIDIEKISVMVSQCADKIQLLESQFQLKFCTIDKEFAVYTEECGRIQVIKDKLPKLETDIMDLKVSNSDLILKLKSMQEAQSSIDIKQASLIKILQRCNINEKNLKNLQQQMDEFNSQFALIIEKVDAKCIESNVSNSNEINNANLFQCVTSTLNPKLNELKDKIYLSEPTILEDKLSIDRTNLELSNLQTTPCVKDSNSINKNSHQIYSTRNTVNTKESTLNTNHSEPIKLITSSLQLAKSEHTQRTDSFDVHSSELNRNSSKQLISDKSSMDNAFTTENTPTVKNISAIPNARQYLEGSANESVLYHDNLQSYSAEWVNLTKNEINVNPGTMSPLTLSKDKQDSNQLFADMIVPYSNCSYTKQTCHHFDSDSGNSNNDSHTDSNNDTHGNTDIRIFQNIKDKNQIYSKKAQDIKKSNELYSFDDSSISTHESSQKDSHRQCSKSSTTTNSSYSEPTKATLHDPTSVSAYSTESEPMNDDEILMGLM